MINAIGVDALEGYLSARSGDLEGGERLARRAVEQAAHVDFFWIRGLTFTLFGKTMSLAGKPADAAEGLEEALRIYENKGDTTSAAQICELLASVAIPP